MITLNHMGILNGEGVVIQANGQLKSETVSELRDYIQHVLSQGTRYVLLDAAGLLSVSSAGFGVLILIHRMVSNREGFFIVFGLNDELKSVFKILGFNTVLNFARSRIEAMEVIDRQRESGDDKLAFPPEHESTSQDEAASDDEQWEPVTRDNEQEPASGEPVSSTLDPFITQCSVCNAKIRIKSTGTFICPSCGTQFDVHDDGAITFPS